MFMSITITLLTTTTSAKLTITAATTPSQISTQQLNHCYFQITTKTAHSSFPFISAITTKTAFDYFDFSFYLNYCNAPSSTHVDAL